MHKKGTRRRGIYGVYIYIYFYTKGTADLLDAEVYFKGRQLGRRPHQLRQLLQRIIYRGPDSVLSARGSLVQSPLAAIPPDAFSASESRGQILRPHRSPSGVREGGGGGRGGGVYAKAQQIYWYELTSTIIPVYFIEEEKHVSYALPRRGYLVMRVALYRGLIFYNT